MLSTLCGGIASSLTSTECQFPEAVLMAWLTRLYRIRLQTHICLPHVRTFLGLGRKEFYHGPWELQQPTLQSVKASHDASCWAEVRLPITINSITKAIGKVDGHFSRKALMFVFNYWRKKRTCEGKSKRSGALKESQDWTYFGYESQDLVRAILKTWKILRFGNHLGFASRTYWGIEAKGRKVDCGYTAFKHWHCCKLEPCLSHSEKNVNTRTKRWDLPQFSQRRD